MSNIFVYESFKIVFYNIIVPGYFKNTICCFHFIKFNLHSRVLNDNNHFLSPFPPTLSCLLVIWELYEYILRLNIVYRDIFLPCRL